MMQLTTLITSLSVGLLLVVWTISSSNAYQLRCGPTYSQQSKVKSLSTDLDVNKGNDECETYSRRKLIALTSSLASWLLIDPSLSNRNQHANAVDGVIRSKGCYQGIGEGCDDVSDDNPLIRQLQEKSKLNKDRNEKEALYAYYMKNYPDFFSSIGQVMIKKESDNTFTLVSPQEAQRLKDLGKLSYEIPKTSGGRIIDYTQKPILILKD